MRAPSHFSGGTIRMSTGTKGVSQRFTAKIGNQEIIIETGKLAEQAGGAVTVGRGDAVLLATATMSNNIRPGMDFFPLSVDYEERMYAAGRIPGSFFRREGRPTEQAILTSRVTDRSLRPLFPHDMRNDVQVIVTAFSHDQEHQVDMLCIIGASAALSISNIPWDGPIAGVRIGMINNELVVNPTIPEMENSLLDLRVAGTKDAVIMVEAGATEVDEATMVKALRLAHDSMQDVIRIQSEMREKLGKTKSTYIPAKSLAELTEKLRTRVESQIVNIVATYTDHDERETQLDDLRDIVLAEYADAETPEGEEVFSASRIKESYHDIVAAEVPHRVIQDGIPPDGAPPPRIRLLSPEVGVIPRVHVSGLFKRGMTQVLSLATLGTPRDVQQLDGLDPEDSKRYMHHYNMPPFASGEASPMRGPKRREIGHGALAETALRSMLPAQDEFPYTLRVVSEVLSSNGSTSMASVCGSTLALMDPGVPINRPLGGIPMGLMSDGDKFVVLTDIQGLEDHIGDMDFKVAGTEKGITALQMDIKIKGISDQVLAQALEQARDARMKILKVMLEPLPESRKNLSQFAPRMNVIKIDPEKIGAIIGPGGKTIRALQEKYGVKIDIEEDGTVFVSGAEGPSADRAVESILGMTEDAEIGRIYTGKVTRIEPYGAFVEFLPGKDGLVHISQLSDHRIERIEDEVALGDELMVMVTDVDPTGKVRLTRQAVLEDWTPEEARERDRGGRPSGGRPGGDPRGGGGDPGGNPGGGGYPGGDAGGHRRPRQLPKQNITKQHSHIR